MEFGERLKQAREKKGMTQQTLAERLFVTRQTVSRWENGVRYPDILTVRKFVGDSGKISLDDLLSQENPKQLVERSPVLENPAAGRLQTAVYMLAAVPYLFRVLGLLWESGIGTGYTPETAEVFWELPVTAICAAAILFGAGKSVAGQMTPKMVCAMTGIYFLAAVISRAISIFTWTDPEGELRVYASGGGTLLFLLILWLFCLCCWRSLPLLYGKEVMFSECGIHRVSAAGILQHIVICRQDVFCLSGRESFCRYQLLRYAAALFRKRQFRPADVFSGADLSQKTASGAGRINIWERSGYE